MRVTLILLAFAITNVCFAQQGGYTAFTVNDGLPSNYIYRCIEDKKGFLWVATDAGIARFDGKHFQVFTTQDGLPDNEVLDVIKENDGRIWVNCFKQGPAYFDEVQNRFFNAATDSNLAKAKIGTSHSYIFPISTGGVIYSNDAGCFVFKDKKLVISTSAKERSSFLIKASEDGSMIKYMSANTGKDLKAITRNVYLEKNEKLIDSISLTSGRAVDFPLPAINDGNFYLFFPAWKKLIRCSNFTSTPFSCKIDSVDIPETFFFYGFTDTWLNIYCLSGKIYVFDKKTLQLQFIMSGDYVPGAMYNDSRQNIWVSTIDKGLIVYKKGQLNHVWLPAGFNNTNFLSINYMPGGALLAGNYSGQLLKKEHGVYKVLPCPLKNTVILRQRKIIVSQNKIFTFSENGIFVNNTRQLISKKGFLFGKTAVSVSDSLVIVGTSTGITKLNTINDSVYYIRPISKRVTALAKAVDNAVYFGSTDGLYRYNYLKDSVYPLTGNHPLLSERITALCFTPDSLLWIATASNGIICVKQDSVIAHITVLNGIVDNETRSIATARPGQVWIGTWGGISIIRYTLLNSKISIGIQNLSIVDGLTNGVINEMVYHGDSVYAATSNGISVIPASINIPRFNIPVQLVRISINQRDTTIASDYNLGPKSQYIQMQFAGIELAGHFKNLQYTLDGNKNWITIDNNILVLQLSSGGHTVQVRAVDVNGNISNLVFTFKFNIATPFWKAAWFWVVIAIALQLITLFAVMRAFKKKRSKKLARQMAIIQTAALEQQAFTSLINPHFMFNALNSIQHYINLQDRKNANRYLSDFASLIRKNFEAAQKSFISLEEEIENVKIYLRLEQMRFNGRFSYEVNIAENTDIDEWMVPTMMLQPFLENALLHGIMPSKKEGRILIDIETKDNNLILTITDNGIGIANSRALKLGTGHNSLGIGLIEKRVAALSRVSTKVISICFSPLCEDAENPGTKIVLFMQQGLYQAWLNAQKH